MIWRISHRADPHVVPIADRHYNRQKIGSPQFAPPGRCFVLRAGTIAQLAEPWQGGAFWITSWPFAQYVRHAWAGAWVNSAFRNEGAGLSSDLIRQAISATRSEWPDAPSLGLITFVDHSKIKGKRDPGYCYLKAGFEPARCPQHATKESSCAACHGRTRAGLVALQLLPHAMPVPTLSHGQQRKLVIGGAA